MSRAKNRKVVIVELADWNEGRVFELYAVVSDARVKEVKELLIGKPLGPQSSILEKKDLSGVRLEELDSCWETRMNERGIKIINFEGLKRWVKGFKRQRIFGPKKR